MTVEKLNHGIWPMSAKYQGMPLGGITLHANDLSTFVHSFAE